MNIYHALTDHFYNDPDRILLTTTEGRAFTQGKVDRASARLANFLTGIGAMPGDRISVQVEKSVENLCLYLACLRAGLVFHPLNPAYKAAELDYFLGNAEPFAVVCDPANCEPIEQLAARFGIEHVLTLDSEGQGSLISQSAASPEEFETVPRADDDLASLLYSSGTTGQPKGIMLSHKNLHSNAEALAQAWGITEEDCLFHALPIFHAHGLFIAIGSMLIRHGTLHWASKFTAELAKENLPQCTMMMGVPTFYTRLLSDLEFGRAHCAKMRLFISGSAPLMAETFAAFEDRTGHRILERYGMTETVITCSNPYEGERKPGAVGPPLPGVSVRILDDMGETCAVGEVGDLQVKGENVFHGYWRMPDKTEEDFTDDRFFKTGDQACLDKDGYVSIVGRSKDMVISGGLNVYPKEVEGVLAQIPGVAEVAVIGLPHPDFGEAVVAVIVPDRDRLSAETIIAQTKTELANFKVPKHVHFVDALPRNAMSKVQKKVLRDALASLFV